MNFTFYYSNQGVRFELILAVQFSGFIQFYRRIPASCSLLFFSSLKRLQICLLQLLPRLTRWISIFIKSSLVLSAIQHPRYSAEAGPSGLQARTFGTQSVAWSVRGAMESSKHKPESCSEAPRSIRAREDATLQFLKEVRILKK